MDASGKVEWRAFNWQRGTGTGIFCSLRCCLSSCTCARVHGGKSILAFLTEEMIDCRPEWLLRGWRAREWVVRVAAPALQCNERSSGARQWSRDVASHFRASPRDGFSARENVTLKKGKNGKALPLARRKSDRTRTSKNSFTWRRMHAGVCARGGSRPAGRLGRVAGVDPASTAPRSAARFATATDSMAARRFVFIFPSNFSDVVSQR